MPPWLDLLLQGAAYTGSAMSIWLIGRKNIWGLWIGVLEFFPWAILGWFHHLIPMIVFDAFLSVLNLRAIFLWRKSTCETI